MVTQEACVTNASMVLTNHLNSNLFAVKQVSIIYLSGTRQVSTCLKDRVIGEFPFMLHVGTCTCHMPNTRAVYGSPLKKLCCSGNILHPQISAVNPLLFHCWSDCCWNAITPWDNHIHLTNPGLAELTTYFMQETWTFTINSWNM